jgi:hypothetical protein
VRLDLEGDRPAVADVDHAGVLADPDEQLLAHLVGGVLAPQREVHLARLVGAVLRPHHGVHRQLGARRTAADDLADVGVLVLLESELCPGLLDIRCLCRVRDGVDGRPVDLCGHAVTAAFRTEVKKPSPSVEGP